MIGTLDKKFGFDIFNLGNSNVVELKVLIELIERNLGKKAKIKMMPDQPGDVPVTYADVSKAKRMLGYDPHVRIEEGIERFVQWYTEEQKLSITAAQRIVSKRVSAMVKEQL
jgi:UDP-glucuronate 4-epimerase